jgi:hypothetical protein
MNTLEDKFFSIVVLGKDSAEAELGKINKSTGLPDGPTTKIKVQVGAVAIPNHSKVWAKRKVNKAGKYEGELEFLPWGEKGGELVAIRYIAGCPTLDKHYQINTLKIDLSEEEKNETAYIDLQIGVNDFVIEDMDPKLIEMLAHHTFNEDNKSRKKDSREVHFRLYNAANINKDKLNKLRQKKAAEDIILKAEDDTARIEILGGLFELDLNSQPGVIFNNLIDILEEDPERIRKVIDSHKNLFGNMLTNLIDKKVIVHTGDDDVVFTDGEDQTVLLRNIPTKNIQVYLVENILEPEVFAIYQEVKNISNKLLEILQ